MKKQSENRFSPINAENTKDLTNVVIETLAGAFVKPRIFSVADMWDIQRRGRTMMQRRHYA